MGKLRTATILLRTEGFRGVARAIARNTYSRETFLLYWRSWDLHREMMANNAELRFFLAGVEYLPTILDHWPAEFSRMGRDRPLLEMMLRERWYKEERCFVVEFGGRFGGALWTEKWRWGFEQALGGESERIFEFVNVFICPAVRGLGAGSGLIQFAGHCMAEQGYKIGIGRVRLDRPDSIAMFERSGFERKGCLVSGLVLGREMVLLRQNGSWERQLC